ncbi:alpha/beta fold hydrolase [Burkholderia sp. BCC1999]|uniref:alpha/beta fold hydrolase n=1 Tax=Burkholderia sp. BCC1999 TaxID=2817448 RepID=UPI002AC3329A|nr:alpha/beta fold hydrolase [Burkholderia sp. BCC1999]
MNPIDISPAARPAGNHDGLGYLRHGTGPERVMVLHDWLGDATNYAAALPYLDETAFTYVFVDLRGYGASRHLSGTYTIDEISADCLALADRLGWQRFHVIGHSMTGMATQRIAADAPSRIKRAIAVCPVSAASNRLGDDARAFFASTTVDDDAFRRLV